MASPLRSALSHYFVVAMVFSVISCDPITVVERLGPVKTK